MPTIDQIVQQIRTATYGREIRTALADGIEMCYDDAEGAAAIADAAAGNANDAASAANAAATKITTTTVNTTTLAPGSSATASVVVGNDGTTFTFGIPTGNSGKDFHIARTFLSEAAMRAYSGSDIEAYDFVMIDTGSVQDPETGRLYCYEPATQDVWRFIGDLSGAQGIKGETGNGIATVTLNNDYTLTITYTNGTSVTTSSIRGATGAAAHVYIRYAADEPTSDSDMKTTVDKWMGIYAGDASSAPTTYTSYMWYKIKGESGSIDNAYASTIYMSENDQQHTIKDKIDALEGKIVYSVSEPQTPVEGMIWLKPIGE
jgi:hypothetical protein